MSDHREAIAEVLFRWNTPDDPYFVIRGRIGETSEADPYLPIADALLGSDVLAQIRAEARAEAVAAMRGASEALLTIAGRAVRNAYDDEERLSDHLIAAATRTKAVCNDLRAALDALGSA